MDRASYETNVFSEKRNLDRFRKRLLKARHKNVDGYPYVPRIMLDKIADSDMISKIIAESNLRDGETDPLLANTPTDGLEKIIHEQAKITFVIICDAVPHCLRHMTRLIKYADNKGSEVDNRLPFSRRELCSCFFPGEDAEHFYSTQWQFIAPKIRLGAFVPTEFGPEVILPLEFNEAEQRLPPDTGAFGTVMEVCVQEGHQVEPAYTGRLVRKQFHQEMPKQSFLRELRNLCILSSARHDNIVQLLGAYIQKDSFNLIFPLVSHGTLDQLFHSDSPLSWPVMESEESLVMALSGLASALVAMHEFTKENIRMIGCHRDLKPANILVDGKRFLLADFGLSRIVDSQETSSSTAPNVVGDFIAPEHEDKDFNRKPIGRSSDIWAFGCVTLMLLVFCKEGKRGLHTLESKRRIEWPNYAHYCFHDYDKANMGLEESIQKLTSTKSPSIRGLLHLVKKILVLEKNLRPKATAIDAHLQCLVIYTCSKAIEEAFGKVCKSDYIHVHFERARFQGWQSAVKIGKSDFPDFQPTSTFPLFGRFESVLEHLRELQVMLLSFSDDPINQGRKAFLPVRSRIDHLLEALDEETRTSALAHTECIILGSKRLSWLQELQRLCEKTQDERTKNKVAIRRHILRPESSEKLYVDFATLQPHPQLTKLSKVNILRNKAFNGQLVIAEEARAFGRYQDSQALSYDYQRKPSRLQEIATLLRTSGQNGLFNVLSCCGYYYHHTKLRSGLLYELPNGPYGKMEDFVTLHEILSHGTTSWCLGDRFNLARGLAAAIYELHSVAWLHRNVSASNIAFFYNEARDNIDPKSFYFVGFAQSRADRDFTDSDGAQPGSYDEEYYRHPDYLSKSQGYLMHHDYHALGMLLLEVGLWKLFPNAVGDRSVNLTSAVAMKEVVPQLGWLTGSHYCDAVVACLDGTLSDASLTQQGQKVPLVFRARVVDRLGLNHCRA